jgi:hypothetical protein
MLLTSWRSKVNFPFLSLMTSWMSFTKHSSSLIPVIDNSQPAIENIGVGMYSSLMGTFDFSAPIHHVYAMSNRPASAERSIPFRTST